MESDNLCLVICKDDEGVYRIATRQLMNELAAKKYVEGIDAERVPLIVHSNVDWNLRH